MMSSPSHSQRVGIVYNPDKERAPLEYKRLKSWLIRHKVIPIGDVRVTPAMRSARFVIALGGDGTVLRAARETSAWNIPVLGVNVGHLGFLAATEVGAMYRTLIRMLAGHGRVETRTMLSVSGVCRGKKFGPYLALNDAVVRTGAVGRVLSLQALLHGAVLARYAGDGVIISTPTGSTAYNLAASGPIVHPELDVLLLSPICPHSLSQRPLVYPASEVISVEVKQNSPTAILSVDGHAEKTLGEGDRVDIRRASEQAQLLMDPNHSYYQVLHTKLKWGGS